MTIETLSALCLAALATGMFALPKGRSPLAFGLGATADADIDLLASHVATGGDARTTFYFTPAGKGTGRDGPMLGLKTNY